jgi:hypothetical protein
VSRPTTARAAMTTAKVRALTRRRVKRHPRRLELARLRT